MAAKKTDTSRVSPPINVRATGITYGTLDDGDAFIYQGRLCFKIDVCDQEGVRLDKSGEYFTDLCEEVVLPVDIKITWKAK